MAKRSKEKRKKYSFLLFIAVCIVFFTVIFVMYRFSGEDTATYFVEDDDDLALVSVSPYNEAGVSEDSQIVIEWNHAVSAEAADDIEISPSVRGDWTAAGNQLVFTPQQFAGGTYYTVYMPKGTLLNNEGDILSEDIYFSFETEDPSLRIPDTESFSVGGNQYHFSGDDTIAIPVSCIGEDDFDVNVAVYRAENLDGYIDAFAKLFSYPSWAELTIEKWKASLRYFDQISESAMAVKMTNDTPSVVLGSLADGAYLVRMTAAGSSYDVAVTVGGIDQTVFFDGENLNLWCHQNDARATEGEVTVAGEGHELDEDGFVSIPLDISRKDVANVPSLLAVTVSVGDEETVYFVTADDLEPDYDGSLIVDETALETGDDLTVSGNIDLAGGVFTDDAVTLTLTSDSGVLDTVETETKDGCFSYTWEALTFPTGDYRVNLIYDGVEQASTAFSMGTEMPELHLLAKSDVDAVENGGGVTYTVTVLNRDGEQVDDAVVTMNGEESQSVNSAGKAQFSTTYDVGSELPVVQKNAVFTVTSPYGEADPVTVSVAVASSRAFIELSEDGGTAGAQVYRYVVDDGVLEKEENADNRVMITVYKDGEKLISAVSDEKTAFYAYDWDDSVAGNYTLLATAGNVSASISREVSGADGDTLQFLYEDGLFRVAEEGESASYTLHYLNGNYTDGDTTDMWIDAADSLTAKNGKNIVANATVRGAEPKITVVSLYKGVLPPDAGGVAVSGEGLYEIDENVPEESRVFFGDEAISAAFSGENRKGDYYIRIWSESESGDTVSCYIPVTVAGVTLLGTYDDCYAAGKEVSLPFYLDTEETLSYQLTLNDDLSYSGSCDDSFTIDTKIDEAGNYEGTLRLLDRGNTVASLAVSFTVYEKEPVFYDVSDGYDDDAFLVFSMPESDEDAVKLLFSQSLEPGNQMLQQMGRTLFFAALGENASYLANDIDYDLLPMQNSDGGFGRYETSESDLLLSVFVAAQDDFQYDKAALKSYFLYRLANADDQETAALACWGLSCFDVDCSKSMAKLAHDNALTLRGKLYLAEAYLAAGDSDNAEKVYRQLKKKLVEENGVYHFNDSNEQFNIANTAFMYQIALALHQEESDGILTFLLNAEIESQTGRYLLALGLLKTMDTGDIVLASSAEAEDGEALISLTTGSTADFTALNTVYTLDGEKVDRLNVDDVAQINITWESEENSIFLVYIIPDPSVEWIQKDRMICRKGYLQWITADNTASITFRATKAGSSISPAIYIVNLTSGKVVGSTVGSGIEVAE